MEFGDGVHNGGNQCTWPTSKSHWSFFESLFSDHQQAKSLADQFRVKMSSEPFRTPQQSDIPEEAETVTPEVEE